MEKARGRNGLKWLGLSILVFILLFQLVAWRFLDPVLENAIKAQVRAGSQGRYLIESLELDSDVLRGNFSLKNIDFRSDSAWHASRLQAGDSSVQSFRLHIPAIQLEGIYLFRACFQQRLKLSRIHFLRPSIELLNRPARSTSPARMLPHVLLADYFHTLDIGEVSAEGGEIHFPADSAGSAALRGIAFRSRNWALDPHSDSWAAVLQHSTIELAENDYSFLFGHSAAVWADKVSYDVRSCEFRIQRLKYAPDREGGRPLTHPGRRLEVEVAALELSGVTPEDLLAQSLQRVDRISVSQPELRLFGESALQAGTGWDSLQVPAFLRDIDIGQLALEGGEFTWYRNPGDSLGQVAIRQIFLTASQPGPDATPSDDLLQRLLHMRIDLQLGAWRFAFPAQGYLLTGQALDYASESDRLILKGLTVLPAGTSQGRRASAAEMEVPVLEIRGWDQAAFRMGQQRWASVVLHDPVIRLPGDLGAPASGAGNMRQVSGLGKSWQIDHFQIKNGQIGTHNGDGGQHQFAARRLNAQAHDLRGGSRVKHGGYFPVDARALYFDLEVDAYRYLSPDSSMHLQLSNLLVSGRDSLISGKSAHLHLLPVRDAGAPDSTGLQELTVAVAGWELSGLRLLDLLRNRQLQASRLTLRAPDMQLKSKAPQQRVRLETVLERRSEWKKLYPLLAPVFASLALGELEIEAGRLRDARQREGLTHLMEFPEYDLRLADIRIDSARHEDPQFPFYFNDIFFALKDYQLALGDSIHALKVGKMGISSRAGLVYFSNIELRYDSTRLDRTGLVRLPNLYRADIPLISLEQTDLFEAIRTRRLEVDEIYIHAPHAALSSFPEFQQAILDSLDAIQHFDRPDLYNPVSRILDALAVEKFRLAGGTFLFNTQNEAVENGFKARNISVDIRNFVIDSTAQRRTDRYFYADSMNVGINVSDYTYITPDSAYRIRVGNIGVMSATEQIYADSIYLLPYLNSGAAAQSRAFVPRITLEGLNIGKAYFYKEIDARRLEIRNPEWTQYQAAGHTEPEKGLSWNRDSLHHPLRKLLLGSYHAVHLEEIDLQSGRWQQMRVAAGDTTPEGTYSGLFAHATGFRLDTLRRLRDPRFLFADDWTLGMRQHRLRTADSLYFFEVGKVALSTGGGQLQVDSIRLIPRYSKEEFAQKKGEWVDRMEVSLPRLVLRRLNIDSLLFRQKTLAGRLDISGLDVRAFKDKRLPEPEDMQPKLLLEQLRSVPLHFRIDTLDLGDTYLEYGELVPDAEEPGVFHIEDLSARVQPFTNDPVLLNSPTVMHISTLSRVMGSGDMRLRFQYPLNDSEGRFRFEGEIDSMDLADFNPMIAHAAFFQVNSGQMHKMTFFIDADRKLARGKMRFYYNDLNISFLGSRKREEGEEPDPRRFASFLANTFVLRSDNPVRRYLRVGKIYFERNERRSIFNYWAHAALSGVKASIGAKNDKDKDKAAGWARKLNPD